MYKTVSIAIAAAALASVPTAASARAKAPACAPVTQQQVEAQFARFNDAWATKDPAKVTSLFSKDAVLLATVSNRPRTDHAQINDYFVGFLKGSPVGTINTSTTSIGCNIAHRVGTWTVAMTGANGARSDVKARYSFIYTWENGDWKIAHLHSSMMPEPGA